MHQAKSELSKLVARAEAGEEIVIARGDKPVVRIVPVGDQVKRQREGAHDIDWFEHAPDDYISKAGIAAYYKKHPADWDEMRQMVGFGEDKQSEYDVSGIRQAVETGKEFTILHDGKAVAKVVPADAGAKRVRGFGILAHLPAVPDGAFFEPLSDEELRAWEGEQSYDPDKAGS
jgi:prevent-host-death family protein